MSTGLRKYTITIPRQHRAIQRNNVAIRHLAFRADEQPDCLQLQESIEDVLNNLDNVGKALCNGRFCAFTNGGRLNDNTAAIRIEKGDTKVGAYAAINQMF